MHAEIVAESIANLRAYARTLSRHGYRLAEKKTFAEVVVDTGFTDAFRFYGRNELMAQHVSAFADDIEKQFTAGGSDEVAAKGIRAAYAHTLARNAFDTSKRYDPVDILIESVKADALIRACESLRVTVSALLSYDNVCELLDTQAVKHEARQRAPASFKLTKTQGVYSMTVYTRGGDVVATEALMSRNKVDAQIEAGARLAKLCEQSA